MEPLSQFCFLKCKSSQFWAHAFQFWFTAVQSFLSSPPVLIGVQIAVSTLSSCASHIQNRVFCALQNKIAVGQSENNKSEPQFK